MLIFLLVLINFIGNDKILERLSAVFLCVLELSFVIIELVNFNLLLKVFVILIIFWLLRVLVIKKIFCGLLMFFNFYNLFIKGLLIFKWFVVLMIIRLFLFFFVKIKVFLIIFCVEKLVFFLK